MENLQLSNKELMECLIQKIKKIKTDYKNVTAEFGLSVYNKSFNCLFNNGKIISVTTTSKNDELWIQDLNQILEKKKAGFRIL